jgi:hypothetical protein
MQANEQGTAGYNGEPLFQADQRGSPVSDGGAITASLSPVPMKRRFRSESIWKWQQAAVSKS